jgi:DNA-binding NtrC family response regulator
MHGELDATAITVESEGGGAGPAPERLWLWVLWAPGAPIRGPLAELGERPLVIGRDVDPGAGIRLPSDRASKRHAEIVPARGGGWRLCDLGSRNGTWVGGARIDSAVLDPGAIVRLGDVVLAVIGAGAPVSPPPASGLVGGGPTLARLLEHIERVAKDPVTVLIGGETGTGKELTARWLHRRSGRPRELIAVNCGALPESLVASELFGHRKGAFSGAAADREGLFRAADGGTLFLDEIGELPLEAQAALLRAIETKTVRPLGASESIAIDVRIVAATNRDLRAAALRGDFRADLFARLAEVELVTPPLRRRPEDLEALMRHFAAALGAELPVLRGRAFEALALYEWPHNLRELRAVVRELVATGRSEIRLEDLPERFARPSGAPPATSSGSRDSGDPVAPSELRRLLAELRGNVTRVAAALDRDRTQVYRWLRRYGIDPARYREAAASRDEP